MRFCPDCQSRLTRSSGYLLKCVQCGYTQSEPDSTRGSGRISKSATEQPLGFEYRPWQPNVIERIVNSIKQGKRVMLDGPTGSGKTLIALQSARDLLSQRRFEQAFIAVRTINELIPFERDIRRFFPSLQYRYMLGKKRACPFYTEGDDQNSALCGACLKGKDGAPPRMVVNSPAVLHDFKRGLYFLEEKYVRAVSQNKGSILRSAVCLYHSMKEIQGTFHLVTYPYITNRKISEPPIFGETSIRDALGESLLIVDEVHNLEGSSDLFTDKLSPKIIENAGRGMLNFKQIFRSKQDFSQFDHQLTSLEKVISTYCKQDGTTERIDKQELKRLLNEEICEIVARIEDASAKIEKIKQKLALTGSTKRIANPLFLIVDFFSNFEENYEKIELFAENGGLSLKILDPAENLSILNEAKGLLLMSGTMPPKTRIEQVWGLENVEEISLLRDYPDEYYSVFPVENRKIEFVSNASTKYETRSELMWSRYASIIEQAHLANENRITLVCCPSYSVAQRIHAALSENYKDCCYLETTRTRLEDITLQLNHGSLVSKWIVIGVARGKILEGVEFVNAGSSVVGAVVIAGIPYPMLDEIQKWRAKVVLKRLGLGEDNNAAFELFMHQPATIAIKQAMGRAIRFPTDTAIIYLADSRFKQELWRKELE